MHACSPAVHATMSHPPDAGGCGLHIAFLSPCTAPQAGTAEDLVWDDDLVTFDVTAPLSSEICVEMGRLTRTGNMWSFMAMGRGDSVSKPELIKKMTRM